MQKAKRPVPLRDVDPDELLEPRESFLDRELIRARIRGKVVLVTGAAGSIGSALSREIAGFNPAALIGIDQAESPLFALQCAMQREFPKLAFHAELANITGFEDINRVMDKYVPSIVCHAAAYKHISMLEGNVFAAAENNVIGTWHVARAAALHGVESFVLVSSDKAVRPTSVLGVTKRIAEMAVHAMNANGGTRFLAVRFGNVWGSSGSVVPIFRQQIAAGGPVTVTHPEMQRYFMTDAEASQLVLQTLTLGLGGETFVLDMGRPLMILDLARKLIRLSGLDIDRDIEVEFTGIRPGEKLSEELHSEAEYLKPTSNPRVSSVAASVNIDVRRIEAAMEQLQRQITARDLRSLIEHLRELVPEYTPSSQVLASLVRAPLEKSGGESDRHECNATEPLLLAT